MLVAGLISCGGSGGSGSSGGGAGGGSGTTTVSGKVVLSSVVSSGKPMLVAKAAAEAQKASLALHKSQNPQMYPGPVQPFSKPDMPGGSSDVMMKIYDAIGLMYPAGQFIGTVELYDAERPEYLYPIAEGKVSLSGDYNLTTTSNASFNEQYGATYADGDLIPAGKYTLIAQSNVVATGQQYVAVQAVVQKFAGNVMGKDLVAQDTDAVPFVVSMFALGKNSDGTYGTDGGGIFYLPSNSAVQVTFSMAMARLGVIDAISIKDSGGKAVDGKWKVSPDLLSATFYHNNGNTFTVGETYTVTVTGADSFLPEFQAPKARNVYGKAIPATVVGTFTVTGPDTIQPEAVRTSPTSLQKANMPLIAAIRIGSDEPLDLNSMEVNSTMYAPDGTTATEALGAKPTVLFVGKSTKVSGFPYIYDIVPAEPLVLGATYYITVSGATDLAGNKLIEQSFNFKVEPTSEGITAGAGSEEQKLQAQAKDIFGKWVRALNDRSVSMLTTYMAGDFSWITNGTSSDDINRDGRLSLGEFTGMLTNWFDLLEGCGSSITGEVLGAIQDTSTPENASANMVFKLIVTSTDTMNSACKNAQPEGVMYAELMKRNGAWQIVRGADFVPDPSTTMPSLEPIRLISPADDYQTSPSNNPTFSWLGIANVSTYAVVVVDAMSEWNRTGWVAVMDGSGTAGKPMNATFTTNFGIQSDLYVLCNGDEEGVQGCATNEGGEMGGERLNQLRDLFNLDRSLAAGLKEGGKYYWAVIAMNTVTMGDIMTNGNQRFDYQKLTSDDIAGHVVAASTANDLSVSGTWKSMSVSILDKYGTAFGYNPYSGGYDVGYLDSVVMTIQAPAEWGMGLGKIEVSGPGSGYESFIINATFNSEGYAVAELPLFTRGNSIMVKAFKPGSENVSNMLIEEFSLFTKGGKRPAIEITSVTDQDGSPITFDLWNYASNETVQTVDVTGKVSVDVTANTNMYLYVWANGGWYSTAALIDTATKTFTFTDVPVFRGWSTIYMYFSNYEAYLTIEVGQGGGSNATAPIEVSVTGLTPTYQDSEVVVFDAGSADSVTLNAILPDMGTGNWTSIPHYLLDSYSTNYRQLGYFDITMWDGAWTYNALVCDQNGNCFWEPTYGTSAAGASNPVDLPVYLTTGINMLRVQTCTSTCQSRTVMIETTGGTAFTKPVDIASITPTAPSGATMKHLYSGIFTSEWSGNASAVNVELSLLYTSGWASWNEYIDDGNGSYINFGWGQMDISTGTWQRYNNQGQFVASGDISAGLPITLYKGRNIIDFNSNNGWLRLALNTTGGQTYLYNINSVSVKPTLFGTPLKPSWSSFYSSEYQTVIDTLAITGIAINNTGSIVTDGMRIDHSARGTYNTYYVDVAANGEFYLDGIQLTTGYNNFYLYSAIPGNSSNYYIYLTTTGGNPPNQWVKIDSPAHNTAIGFDATISVKGHIDSTIDGFTPSYWEAQVYDYCGSSQWFPQGSITFDGTNFSFNASFTKDCFTQVYIYFAGTNNIGTYTSHGVYNYYNNTNNYEPYFWKPQMKPMQTK